MFKAIAPCDKNEWSTAPHHLLRVPARKVCDVGCNGLGNRMVQGVTAAVHEHDFQVPNDSLQPFAMIPERRHIVRRSVKHQQRHVDVTVPRANARHRRLVVPAPSAPADDGIEPEPVRTRAQMTWAQRLRHVFEASAPCSRP